MFALIFVQEEINRRSLRISNCEDDAPDEIFPSAEDQQSPEILPEIASASSKVHPVAPIVTQRSGLVLIERIFYLFIFNSILFSRSDDFDSTPNCTDTPADRQKRLSRARLLAKITLFINISLTVAKFVASYLSGSLSIISSLVDSIVDITSGLVIWTTSRAITKTDPYHYPVGRTRLEPIALVIVSVIMAVGTYSLQLINKYLTAVFSVGSNDCPVTRKYFQQSNRPACGYSNIYYYD